MKPSTARKLIVGLVFAIIAVNAVLFLSMRDNPRQAPNRIGTNSYPALLHAASRVQDLPSPDDPDSQTRESLKQILNNNAQALLDAKAALAGECWVTFGTNFDRVAEFGHFKRLARTMECEARLALLDNRLADAAEAGVNMARLGHAVAHDGVLIDSMVGVAIERMGLAAIPPPARLDAKTASHVAAELSRLEQQRQSMDEVWAQEVNWARRTYGFKGQLARFMTRSSLEKTRKAWATKYHQAQLQARFAMAEYAVRAYALEQGKPPASWDALAPKYLESIPMVPAFDDTSKKPKPIEFNFGQKPERASTEEDKTEGK